MRIPHITFIITLLLFCTSTRIVAQTCTVFISDTNLCEGSTGIFSVNTSGGTPASYNWNFGDGFSGSTSTANHTYTTAGNYTPTLTVTFVGGATCNTTGKLVRVFANPVSKYTITSADSMCFKGNNLCVIDESTAGASNAPIKKRIFQLSNGYIQQEIAPFPNTICYQNNTDILGHLYTLVLEISDTNNCVSRLAKTDSVRLYPKMQSVQFTQNIPLTCNSTNVTFNNLTNMPLSRVKSYKWIFGDGSFDSSEWLTVSHLYTNATANYAKFVIQDIDGCIDTAFTFDSIKNVIPDPAIYGTSFSQCFNGNSFNFASRNPQGLVLWYVYDQNNNIIDSASTDSFLFEFETCGYFRINMKVKYVNCEFETDSIVTIKGPKAIIQNRFVRNEKILNTSQCEIFDTIYFKTPVPYLTCTNENGRKYHLWDFGDAFAPSCTTDTKNGLNVGMNCNFSLDSMQVKHAYKPGEENCYSTKLYIIDSLSGCEDADSMTLSLTYPDASPDTLASPPRRGLYVMGSNYCLYQNVQFNFYETLPKCAYEVAWINLDSACDKDNFSLADSLGIKLYDHTYSATCNPDGFVTIGLIIKNGNDRNGNPCYDTAWYHHLFQLLPINPNFKASYVPTCKPLSVSFIPDDSIQYDLIRVSWSYGDRNYIEEESPFRRFIQRDSRDTLRQYFSVTDSIVHQQNFQFEKPGVYDIYATFSNKNNCSTFGSSSIAVGFYKRFLASKRVNCLKDSIELFENINYYSTQNWDYLEPTEYWKMPDRASANKEKIWWDIGDGKGFSLTGSSPKFKYDKPGVYTIKMIAQDSIGCKDTLVKNDYITIVDLKPRIGLLQSSYFCAPQIVAFRDSSIVIDSAGAVVSNLIDSVYSSVWDFGDGTPNSILTNPAHNFVSNGNFTITLLVTTNSGCSDTAQVLVNLKGPTPSFTISDTMGCEPFKTTFVNTTGKQLKTWTWYFGDPANQTFTTITDSAVTFTYLKAGVYDVKLLGTENVFNSSTGNVVICNSFFPDVLTNLPERRVYVLPTPPLDVLSKDSVCPNEELVLTAIGDAVYLNFKWIYGDGDTVLTTRPDTVESHVYQSFGSYSFMLIPTNSSGYECVDTVRKDIVVAAVEADFNIDSSASPTYSFVNSSASSVRYFWDFGKPSAGNANTSIAENGVFNYGADTGLYKVCLTSFNKEDCWDSICKEVHISQTRIIIPNVFTPDNSDNKNDAFDIDILGYTQYNITIFNRWGAMVFEGNKDGIANDGINWNGKDKNEGEPCPAGTYYFIFTYKLNTDELATTIHGTITLVRDK